MACTFPHFLLGAVHTQIYQIIEIMKIKRICSFGKFESRVPSLTFQEHPLEGPDQRMPIRIEDHCMDVGSGCYGDIEMKDHFKEREV